MGQMLYTTFNESDFDNMAKQYNYRNYGAGYDKPNSTANANPQSRNWNFVMSDLYKRKGMHNLYFTKNEEREVESLLMVQWVIRSIPHGGPIELFLYPASAP